MKFAPFILVLGLIATSDTDDTRLNGTWHSNRDETVADAFKRDPRWTNASPAKIAGFRDLFGHMTITYSNGIGTSLYDGKESTWHYRVVERGNDFVVIRSDAWGEKRIRFVNGDQGYWIDAGFPARGLQEKFDRVSTNRVDRK
jgi:hypothetical protein